MQYLLQKRKRDLALRPMVLLTSLVSSLARRPKGQNIQVSELVVQHTPIVVIVDGTRDISGIEQESICIRYVSEDLVTMEVFLNFYEVEVTTGNNIAQVVQDTTNSDFRFRIYGLKCTIQHRKFQKFSQTCRAHDAHRRYYFLYPHFSDESYAPDGRVGFSFF